MLRTTQLGGVKLETKFFSRATVPKEWRELVELIERQNGYRANPPEELPNPASDAQRSFRTRLLKLA